MIPANLQINHIDCDKGNNVFSNLEVVTASENMRHAYDNGLMNIRSGESCSYAKLTEDQARQVLSRCNVVSDKDLAVEFDVTVKTIGRIRRREIWKHLEETLD